MLSRQYKWILWLKSMIVTIIVMILLLEVFIVSNEAKKLLRVDAVQVSCNRGALNLNYGDANFKLGPSIDELSSFTSFLVNDVVVNLPPFNLIFLAKQAVDFLWV